jgi:hypothetical protein
MNVEKEQAVEWRLPVGDKLPGGFYPVVMDYGTAAAATLVRLIFDNNPELRAKLKEASSGGTTQAEQFLHPWFRAALHLVRYPQ